MRSLSFSPFFPSSKWQEISKWMNWKMYLCSLKAFVSLLLFEKKADRVRKLFIATAGAHSRKWAVLSIFECYSLFRCLKPTISTLLQWNPKTLENSACNLSCGLQMTTKWKFLVDWKDLKKERSIYSIQFNWNANYFTVDSVSIESAVKMCAKIPVTNFSRKSANIQVYLPNKSFMMILLWWREYFQFHDAFFSFLAKGSWSNAFFMYFVHKTIKEDCNPAMNFSLFWLRTISILCAHVLHCVCCSFS